MEAAAGVTFSDRVRWDFVELAYNGPRYTFRRMSLTGDQKVNTHEFTLSIVWSN